MRRSTDDYDQELLRLRGDLASTRLSLLLLKLGLALKRYNPDQPRVPAGSPEGGRWTDGESAQGLFDRLKPRADWASGRPRGGTVTRRINGRTYVVTSAQEARLDVSAAQANAVIREVHRRDKSWQPQPSIYEGVEGQIAANQSAARKATQRLRELGGSPPTLRPPQDELMPKGQPLGYREGGAASKIRTVSSDEFTRLLEAFSPFAQPVSTPPGYAGNWFRRPDGVVFGVRRSEESGMTFELIGGPYSGLPKNFKVHQ